MPSTTSSGRTAPQTASFTALATSAPSASINSHAVADGVLGAYDATANITIAPGQKSLDLGAIEWRPTHFGQQIFQIGTPNRSAKEFYKGDDHWHWGMYIPVRKILPDRR